MRTVVKVLSTSVVVAVAAIGLVALECGTSSTATMNGATQGQPCAPAGSMSRSNDGCNACVCQENGQWACSAATCAVPDGGGSPDGQSTVRCVYQGTTHSPGDDFPSADGCNGCTCTSSGEVACTAIACLAPPAGSDAASPDAGCAGPPPSNGCNACTCTQGTWICGTQQCPPPSDASAKDGSAPDAGSGVACGASTCGPVEWCDTRDAAFTCRCGLVGGACDAGLVCCVNPFSGCAPAHCNERCTATCP
jgi:hypothetical protein